MFRRRFSRGGAAAVGAGVAALPGCSAAQPHLLGPLVFWLVAIAELRPAASQKCRCRRARGRASPVAGCMLVSALASPRGCALGRVRATCSCRQRGGAPLSLQLGAATRQQQPRAFGRRRRGELMIACPGRLCTVLLAPLGLAVWLGPAAGWVPGEQFKQAGGRLRQHQARSTCAATYKTKRAAALPWRRSHAVCTPRSAAAMPG